MFCIVGLGNPGPQYRLTRHNAGFLAVEIIARRCGVILNHSGFRSIYGKAAWEGRKILLLQPQTYMNLSGEAVKSALDYFQIPLSRVLIISDDLDLPCGFIRIKPSGGTGGHKGLKSIFETLGSNDIPRLKIGVGRPGPGKAVADYVLEPCGKEEETAWRLSLEYAADASLAFITEGVEFAMNHFNGKAEDNNKRLTSS